MSNSLSMSKKIPLLLLIAFLFTAGCRKEETMTDGPDREGPVILSASFPGYEAGHDSRTALSGLAVVWHNGDEISLVDNDGVVHVFGNTEASGPSARFSTDLTMTDSGIDGPFDGTHALVYPASEDYERGAAGTRVQGVVVSDSQPLLAGNIGRGCNVSFAGLNTGENYNGDNLTFYNACGLLCLRLRGDISIKSISITAPSGSVIVGSGTVDYAMGGFINEGTYPFTGTDTVTLTPESGTVTLNETVTCFYACVVPAQTYSCDVDGITDNLMSTGTGAKAGTYRISFINELNERITTTATLEQDVCAGRVSTLGQFNIHYGRIDMDPTGLNVVELAYDSAQGSPVTETFYDGDASGWLDVTSADGAIIFKAEVNISGEERSATVRVTSGTKSYDVHVIQKSVSSILSHKSFGCDSGPCPSERIVMPDYVADFLGGWDFVSDSDWFTVSRTGNELSLSIPANTTGSDRRGNIAIRDASGTVIHNLPVLQTHFSGNALLGQHVLKFGGGNYWLLDFIDADGGFAVKAFGYDNMFKTEGYGLRLYYVRSGEGAPKMVLDLPQRIGTFDGKALMLYATSSDGYYSLTDGLGFDLVYSGNADRISFDFTSAESVYDKGFDGGFVGLFFMRGMSKEDWIVPCGEQDCLRLVKWGYGNHDDFIVTEK